MEVAIHLNKLHEAQQQVLHEARRFNVLNCGRRWGKTTLATELLLGPDDDYGSLHGYPVAYFAPTYKMLAEVWREMVSVCASITAKKYEQEKRIELYAGGVIDFWSLDSHETVRGRKYRRAIIDEAATIPNLKEAWTKVIRPLLTDLLGDAWFMSTPKGKNNYFFDLFNNSEKFENWMSWQMPTSSNPYIVQSEIDEAEAQLDPLTFAQEYMASFVTENNNAFCYTFSRDKHIRPVSLNPLWEVKLSFDFNRDPISCLVAQDDGGKKVNFVEMIKLPNSNIYDLCNYIRSKYGKQLILVTGDATGRASSALVRDNLNYFRVIKTELGLGDRQMRQPAINPPIIENRVLVNAAFHHMDISIDPVNCKSLIFDLEHAAVLPDGTLDKTDRKDPTKQLDALDCARYYFQTYFKHILK